MASSKINNKLLSLVTPWAVTLLSFSSLLAFGDRITMKPNQAGFWMLLVFGFTLGLAVTSTIYRLGKKEKEQEK